MILIYSQKNINRKVYQIQDNNNKNQFKNERHSNNYDIKLLRRKRNIYQSSM